MSVIALAPQNFDLSSIEVHPSRSFTSGTNGVTGSINVYARQSTSEKDVELTYGEAEEPFGALKIINLLDGLEAINTNATTSYANHVEQYMTLVRTLGASKRKSQKVSIRHFRPTPTFSSASAAKNFIRKTLYRHCATKPSLNWAYTNFNCLNFFTSSLNQASGYNDAALATGRPTNGTALIYAAATSSYGTTTALQLSYLEQIPAKVRNLYTPYRPRTGFTFEFWINPRYNDLDDQGEFPAGTIMHMSSCYAVSLVTGSDRDLHNKPANFKIMLQLSHSADVFPRDVATTVVTSENSQTPIPNNSRVLRGYPKNLIFMSSASLFHNHWHHVAIVWGSENQDRNGYFVIDGKIDQKGMFLVDSASCCPTSFPEAYANAAGTNVQSDPDALFIGNYYEGRNSRADGSEIARFFNSNASKAYGIKKLRPDITDDPINFSFKHDLQAELHELRIWSAPQDPYYIDARRKNSLNLNMVRTFSNPGKSGGSQFDPGLSGLNPGTNGNHSLNVKGVEFTGNPPVTPAKNRLMFYLPVLFTKESPRREVLLTPYFKASGETVVVKTDLPGFTETLPATNYEDTVTPFNAKLAFTSNVLQINLPNFLRDFSTETYPRLYNLTASIEDRTSNNKNSPSDGFGTILTSLVDFTPRYSVLGRDTSGKEKIAKANLLILPCDNGQFRPYFSLLASGANEQLLQGDQGLDIVRLDKSNPFLDYDKDIFMPKSGSILSKYVNDNGGLDFSLIDLNDMMFQARSQRVISDGHVEDVGEDIAVYANKDVGSVFAAGETDPPGLSGLVGTSPFIPQALPKGNIINKPHPTSMSAKLGILTYMAVGLQDNSSNMVSFFDIPQLYYGDRVYPGSLTLKAALGLVKSEEDSDFKTTLNITLKDNERGSLYRADCKTAHATWNNVGDILYDEGLIIIKSPHLYTLGQNSAELSQLPVAGTIGYGGYPTVIGNQKPAQGDAYSLEFEGDRNIHILEIMIPARAGLFNSSSNPRYENLRPSENACDGVSDFVYITGMNFHDDNFNVIARTNLAQPAIKRTEDKLFFRVKIDF